jgi:hypothetical protein
MNPQWEKYYLIATLELKTLEMDLQEEWNHARTKPVSVPGGTSRRPGDAVQPVRSDPAAASGGESGRSAVLGGADDQRPDAASADAGKY